MKELLRPVPDGQGGLTARLQLFSGCHNLIRTLGALQHDEKEPNDVASSPHELTHAPDALRGYAMTVYEAPEEDDGEVFDGEMQAFLQF